MGGWLKRKRTAYRGVNLPAAMTPACLDELARLFSNFEWDRLERADGELARTADAAVIAFEIVQKHLARTPHAQ